MLADDLKACREAIRHGSKSFHAASHFLPRDVRDAALALYAFCRLADDAVDLSDEQPAAVLGLQDRLDRVYAGRPANSAPDRAFAWVVDHYDMPRALPDALIEGFAWDAMGRDYHSLSDVRAYAARVASSVGAMMAVLMGVRDAQALARACDLGVAMQLTNICRDVGEDAAMGRIYLPRDWLIEAGIDPAAFLRDPEPSEALATVVARVLGEADRLYRRSEAGIAVLPLNCRSAIFAARLIYAAIGGAVARNGFDSITHRAHTGLGEKVTLGLTALGRTAGSTVLPVGRALYMPALPETAFLVDAAAQHAARRRSLNDRVGGMMDILTQLEAMDREQRGAKGGMRPSA
ncbi:MAG: phytoene/squalene synthase family protein [Pseudomonadota bacterium]